jgi:hypothetical protein
MTFNTTNSDIRLHTNAVSRDHLSSLNKSIKSLINYTDGKTKSLSKKTIDLLEKNNIISKKTDEKPVTKSGGKSGGVNRLKKANRWTEYSGDTAKEGIDIGAYGYDKYNQSVNPLSHAVKSKLTGGKSGGVNRLKKADRWTEYSGDTAKEGIDIGAYGYDKYNQSVNPLSHAVKSKLTGGAKKPSDWVVHCKEYAKKNNVSYKEALKMASASYKKKSGAGYNTIR